MNKIFNLLLKCIIISTLSSCSYFIDFIESNFPSKVNAIPTENVSILFSHNINGETHPCGCRHFPLGGLPQVAGLHEKLRKEKKEIFYIDTGDTFFPSAKVPKSMNKSLQFIATELAEQLKNLGLKYFIPGDQDFAAGADFLKNLLDQNKIVTLIGNLNDEKTFTNKRWVKLETKNLSVFMTGLIDPDLISSDYSNLFVVPAIALKKIISEMKKDGYDPKNKNHRLILANHLGIEEDKKLIENFPEVSWIIGSHSQSFVQIPHQVGNTQVVQTLSRNHYIGEVELSVTEDKYTLHEVREDLSKEITPNPYESFLTSHKEKLQKIQLEEQEGMQVAISNDYKFTTVKTCLDCHEAQTEHYTKTAHSLAYITLYNAKEQNNPKCIGCHSLGHNSPHGFIKTKDIVTFKRETEEDDSQTDKAKAEISKNYKSYWKHADNLFKDIKSVRALSKEDKVKLNKQWRKIDFDHKADRNFANVQCLNCHTKHPDHPFDGSDKKLKSNIKDACLKCHDPDQSPDWYKKKENGMPGALDEVKFQKVYQKISCPHLE